VEPTLYVDESEESKRVEELLQRAKLRYRRVVVDGGLLGWLLLEYGAKPPVLVAGDRVLSSPEIERLASGGGSLSEEGERALRFLRRRGCF